MTTDSDNSKDSPLGPMALVALLIGAERYLNATLADGFGVASSRFILAGVCTGLGVGLLTSVAVARLRRVRSRT